MEDTPSPRPDPADDLLDARLAERLKALRQERGWSLDRLAALTGVSRATLSRLESAQVSPTAQVLGRLSSAYGLPLSRLMRMVEDAFTPLLRLEDQPVWTAPDGSFHRRSVSPPASGLTGEVLQCTLAPGTLITYDRPPPRPGMEHHAIVTDGALTLTVGGTAHALEAGDCLRYRLDGPSRFETGPDRSATYFLMIL